MFSCNVDNCVTCSGVNICQTCAANFTLTADGSKCLQPIRDIIQPKIDYTTFDPAEEIVRVQFEESVAGMDLETFIYTLVDKITGEEMKCTLCKSEKIPKNERLLKFSIDSYREILSAQLKVTYPVNKQLKKKSRILASEDDTQTLIIDDLYVSGRAGLSAGTGGAAKRATDIKGSFIAFNSIRFFGFFFLGFLDTVQAFWPTSLFSWLQVWTLFRGPFLAYLERFTMWHRKWYLLVINFGEPFADFADWNLDGKVCIAGNEYPLNRVGCSLTDTFGQNFIVILFILLFCLLVSAAFAIVAIYRRRSNKNEETPSLFGSQFSYKTGLIFFLRFMNAIQPSLCIWSVLQFDTHFKTPNMALGVVISFIFTVYSLTILFLTMILALRIWNHSKTLQNDTELDNCVSISNKVGGWLSCLSFQFNTLKKPTAYYQLLNPVVEGIRVLLICVLVVAVKNPKVGLSFILIVEFLRLCYRAVLLKAISSWVYYVEELLFSLVFFMFVASSLGAVTKVATEITLQTSVALFMVSLIIIVWIICLFNILWDIVVKVKEYRSSETQKKSRKYQEADTNVNSSPTNLNILQMQEGSPEEKAQRNRIQQDNSIDEIAYPKHQHQTGNVLESEQNVINEDNYDPELDEGIGGVYKTKISKPQITQKHAIDEDNFGAELDEGNDRANNTNSKAGKLSVTIGSPQIPKTGGMNVEGSPFI